MYRMLMSTWEEVVRPMILRPQAVQVAALCLRGSGKDLRVLLITSRGSGRWIVPKGWPIDGKSGVDSALQEAWEEAGVRGVATNPEPVGSYAYDKVLRNGTPQPVRTNLYRVDVRELADDFPEAGQRRRRWMRPLDAANLVAEPKLQEILRTL